MKHANDIEEVVIDSDGDVFADLGLELSEEEALKVNIAYAITKIIQSGAYTQAQAAEIMGLDQPKVSKLMRGRLKEFKVDRLMRFLLALGYDMEIRLRRSPCQTRGRVRVVAA